MNDRQLQAEFTQALKRRWYREASKRYMTPREDWAKKGLLTEEPPYGDYNDDLLRLLETAERTQAHDQKED